MDFQKAPRSKSRKRGKLSRSRALDSSNDSSSDEKEEEPRNLGSSRLQLLQDKRKPDKSGRKAQPSLEESRIVQLEAPEPGAKPQVPKESSIAQSIRRKFGFFRRSAEKPAQPDVEASGAPGTPERQNPPTLDVVVDVHCENESQRPKLPRKKLSAKTSDDELPASPDKVLKDSLDLIEEFHEEQAPRPEESEANLSAEQEHEKTIDELLGEALPASGGDAHRRKRWDRPEAPADEFAEDPKKPRRRQWAKGAASAQIRNATGKKIVVPKRAATAEPAKSARPGSALPSRPIAAPRVKSLPKEEQHQAYDNDGFSSEHDEVLRIETVDNKSEIKIGSRADAEIEDGASTLSEEEEKIEGSITRRFSIEEVKEYVKESAEYSGTRKQSTTASPNFATTKPASRRRSSSRRKSSVDKKSVDEDEEEDFEEEEDQETVLNVAEKKARKSSGSSRVEIIPSNFFEKDSSDETTISTNEEMRHTSRRDSRHSTPRSKSKSSKSSKSSRHEDGSERAKRKTSSSTRNSAEEIASVRKKSKSRTKRRARKREKEPAEEVEEETKYISIRVHKCDMLEADYITKHPIVRVHLVYEDAGDYLKQNNKDGKQEDILRPVMTEKFDFKEKKTMVPVWEEELIFEQNYKDLFGEGKAAVLLLFEVLDLMSSAETSLSSDQYLNDSCWHKVAWAFLRPMGISGTRHIDKKVRLQLYRPKKTFRKPVKDKCEAYKWWKSSKDKYPSSLYVTISGVEPPKLEPVFYEQLLELHDVPEVSNEPRNATSAKVTEEVAEPPKWTRLAAQSCQIPNEIYQVTEASDNGCFYVAFSNDGKYLACALSEEYEFPILVYKIDEGKVHVQFSGHKNFIYSLNWSQDDRYLLSVSSDQTARLWDVKEKIIEPIHALPHPSYVYCGKFTPTSSNYIVTGCYDHVARVWARSRTGDFGRQYELAQELEGHESFVNAVCFQPKEEACLTADGLGVVVVWTMKRSRRSPVRREWQIARRIKIKEAEGVPVNSIAMHPLGSRLLVHSRNNGLRLIDLSSGSVVKKFDGLKNQRIQITACISPCGSLLFCGGEDSSLNVWSLESGKLLASYEIGSQSKAVTCVDYHPYDHVLAFATYGAPVPVKILKFDREADGKSVGLKLLAATTASLSLTSRLKEYPLMRNGMRNLELSARSLNTSASQADSIGQLISEYKEDEEVRRNLKGKLQKFIDSGPNLRTKSMTRLNGIIEKIDRILMYATSQKSPAVDLESALEERPARPEAFELRELSAERAERRGKKQRRHRSRSARNACSPTLRETEFSKAFSDSAAFTRKVSRFSDDSSNSNRSLVRDSFLVERLDLANGPESESGLKDSLDTIVDGREDFPSEEVLDVESLKSDDTYVVSKDKPSPAHERNDDSDKSNATFVIESELAPPVPKPRTKRLGRIEVM